ncbi:MAG: RNA 2',3'-cyclic phosphodiesterase [Gemmatales bacterium]|nr:RNA 2',3'-cyclic phosphodiesterase [Gemmatales bacterium]MDW7994933.1 RNA 2',3'-cyclic phosphodiesterase [Gemmatales bacterium]
MARRIRTFIALELTKNIRQKLTTLQEKLAAAIPEVKWVEPENLHVTLFFLGDVPDLEVPEVCRRVEQAVAGLAPFSVSVEGLGCFPGTNRPRVLWAGITKGAQELQQVHKVLERPLHALGYRAEERRYVPHITLGRLKRDRPVPKIAELIQQMHRCRLGEMTASEICIMASQLERSGPIYTVMGRAFFRGEHARAAEESVRAQSEFEEDFLTSADEPEMD